MSKNTKPAVASSGQEQRPLHLTLFDYTYYTAGSPTLANPAVRQAHFEQVADGYAEFAREAWSEGRHQDAKLYELQCHLYRRMAASAEAMKIRLQRMGWEL